MNFRKFLFSVYGVMNCGSETSAFKTTETSYFILWTNGIFGDYNSIFVKIKLFLLLSLPDPFSLDKTHQLARFINYAECADAVFAH